MRAWAPHNTASLFFSVDMLGAVLGGSTIRSLCSFLFGMIGQGHIDGFGWIEEGPGCWIFYPMVLSRSRSRSRPPTISTTRRYPRLDGSEAPVVLGLLVYKNYSHGSGLRVTD